MICPLLIGKSVTGQCQEADCAWWNERFERCSVYVIGDRIDDLAIVMEKEVEPNV